MAEATVVLINPLGLHARAAAKIVKIASSSAATIFVDRPNKSISANATSILSLLELGAKAGTTLIIRSNGDDKDNAFEKIVRLVNEGFGEI